MKNFLKKHKQAGLENFVIFIYNLNVWDQSIMFEHIKLQAWLVNVLIAFNMFRDGKHLFEYIQKEKGVSI